MNKLLFSTTTVAATLAVAGSTLAAEALRPNLLIIIADDLLSEELSCYGGVNINTPNIDKLAEDGVLFSNNIASMAMSVPTRASMYTGLYPVRNGAYRNHKLTSDGVESVLDYMPPLGYRVGRAGKTHFSSRTENKFEAVKGFAANCVAEEVPHDVSGVKKFINKADTPFVLYVCSTNPHAPWTWGDPSEFDPDELDIPDMFVDSPEVRDIYCKYLAEVRVLDNEVGDVMEVLRASGKLDNTVVFFLGEQGPQFPGGKWTLWHPGVSSALIARYPSEIKAGSKSDAIVQYEDVLPTMIDIAGGDPIEKLDGFSFKPALFGESKRHRDYAYGIHNNIPEGDAYPIRSIRDERYALILNLKSEVGYYEKHLMSDENAGKTGVWPAWTNAAKSDSEAQRLVDRYVNRPAVEFYDLKRDPLEMNNLADNPKYKSRIETMRSELLRWMDQQGDRGAEMDVEFK